MLRRNLKICFSKHNQFARSSAALSFCMLKKNGSMLKKPSYATSSARNVQAIKTKNYEISASKTADLIHAKCTRNRV